MMDVRDHPVFVRKGRGRGREGEGEGVEEDE